MDYYKYVIIVALFYSCSSNEKSTKSSNKTTDLLLSNPVKPINISGVGVENLNVLNGVRNLKLGMNLKHLDMDGWSLATDSTYIINGVEIFNNNLQLNLENDDTYKSYDDKVALYFLHDTLVRIDISKSSTKKYGEYEQIPNAIIYKKYCDILGQPNNHSQIATNENSFISWLNINNSTLSLAAHKKSIRSKGVIVGDEEPYRKWQLPYEKLIIWKEGETQLKLLLTYYFNLESKDGQYLLDGISYNIDFQNNAYKRMEVLKDKLDSLVNVEQKKLADTLTRVKERDKALRTIQHF